jgi:hypothetical protein
MRRTCCSLRKRTRTRSNRIGGQRFDFETPDARFFEADLERALDDRLLVDFFRELVDFDFDRDDDLAPDDLRELRAFDFEPEDFDRDVEVFARLDFDFVPDDFDREEPDLRLEDLRELVDLAFDFAPDFDFEPDDFVREDLVSPAWARSLFTVRAAISSARSSERPASRSDSLMCRYCRSRSSLHAFCGIGLAPPSWFAKQAMHARFALTLSATRTTDRRSEAEPSCSDHRCPLGQRMAGVTRAARFARCAQSRTAT